MSDKPASEGGTARVQTYWYTNIVKIPEDKQNDVGQRIKGGKWFDEETGKAHTDFGGQIKPIAMWENYPQRPTPSGWTDKKTMREEYTSIDDAADGWGFDASDYDRVLDNYKSLRPPDAWHDTAIYHYNSNAVSAIEYMKTYTATDAQFIAALQKDVTEATGITQFPFVYVGFTYANGTKAPVYTKSLVKGGGYAKTAQVEDSNVSEAQRRATPQNFEEILLAEYLAGPAFAEDQELIEINEQAQKKKDELELDDDPAIAEMQRDALDDIINCTANRTCSAIEAQEKLDNVDKEIIIEQLKFNAQCVLSGPFNIDTFGRANVLERFDSELIRDHAKVIYAYGDPVAMMSFMTTPPKAETFLKIKEEELAELVPTIRLFKVYRDEKGNSLGEVEFTFDNYTKDILGNGRNGVGIKSFDWHLNATNPFTIRNDMSGKLILYFQNFNDLLKKRPGILLPKGATKWPNGGAVEYSYEELLIRQPTDKALKEAKKQAGEGESVSTPNKTAVDCNFSSLYYDPQYYEIKIVVGWEYNPMKTSLITDYSMKQACKNQKLTMFLVLTEHEFNFDQEGTFSLSVNYRGRLEALAEDARTDVLMSPQTKKDIASIEERLTRVRSRCVATKTGNEKKQNEEKRLEDRIEAIHERNRDDFGQALMTGIENKIYIWSMDREQMGRMRGAARASEKRATKIWQDIIIPYSHVINMIRRPRQHVVVQGQFYADGTKPEFVKADVVQIATDAMTEGAAGSDENAEANETAVDTVGGSAKMWTGLHNLYMTGKDVLHVPWFYFGDLVNIAVQHAMQLGQSGIEGDSFSDQTIQNIQFILGPIALKVVKRSNLGTSQAQTEDEEKEEGKREGADKTQIKNFNLGDIPITLQTFKDWYVNKVVDGKKRNYPLLEFVRDVVEDLVLVAARPLCEELGISQDIRVKTAVVSVPQLTAANIESWEKSKGKTGHTSVEKFGASGWDPLRYLILAQNVKNGWGVVGKHVTKSFSYLDLDGISTFDWHKLKEMGGIAESTTMENSSHYFIIYAENSEAYNLTGNERADRKRGINHLYLGADKGLVKEVNFQMNNAQYLREARYQQDSLNPLAQLAATYNCDLTLVGNTIFWPGQYVYVNPVGYGTGLGSPHTRGSVSNQLGLGGYHLVTKVENFIENGKFETRVKALFETSGDQCARTSGQVSKGACPSQGGQYKPKSRKK